MIGVVLALAAMVVVLFLLLMAESDSHLYWKEQAKIARIQRNAALDALGNAPMPLLEQARQAERLARMGRISP